MLGNELVYAQNSIARKMIEIENRLKNLQSVSKQGSTALYHLMKAAEAGEPDEKYAILNGPVRACTTKMSHVIL